MLQRYIAVQSHLLTDSEREDKTLQTLVQLFVYLCKVKGPSPYGLSSVLQNVPSKYIPVAANFITDSQSQVKDPDIEAILFQMMKWPLSIKISTRLKQLFLMGLALRLTLSSPPRRVGERVSDVVGQYQEVFGHFSRHCPNGSYRYNHTPLLHPPLTTPKL